MPAQSTLSSLHLSKLKRALKALTLFLPLLLCLAETTYAFSTARSCILILSPDPISDFDVDFSERIETALNGYNGFSFFREDGPGVFDKDEFSFNRSYTVMVDSRTKEISFGANIKSNVYNSIKRLIPFARAGQHYSGTHMQLKTLIENERETPLNPSTTFGGSIRFNDFGDINISGFASQQPNPEGLAVIVNIIKEIFPKAVITATPFRLSEILNPRRDQQVTLFHLQSDDRGLRFNSRFEYWEIYK